MSRNLSVLCVAGVLALGALASNAALATPHRPQHRTLDGGSVAKELFTADQLAFDVAAPIEKAVLRVSGPKRFRTRRSFGAGEAIVLDLKGADGARLSDGRYRYTLRISPLSERGGVQVGLFFVEDGVLVSRESKRAELSGIRGRLNHQRGERLGRAKARVGSRGLGRGSKRPAVLDRVPSDSQVGSPPTLYPPYSAPYLNLVGYAPTILFYEYSYYPYAPTGYTGYILQYYGSNYRYSLYANVDSASYGNYRYGFYNLDYGYLNTRDGLFNYDVGYFNTLYAYPGSNTTSAYGFSYGYFFYGGYNLLIGAGYNYATGYYDYQAMYVGPIGVGIGTLYPTADLEIYDYDFAAMRLYSSQGGAQWAFVATPAGNFTVNLIGSGGQELTVRERLDALGSTLDVQGSVRGTQFIATSSREAKTDFVELDGKEILAKLAEIPVMKWRYKTEDQDASHFGPVAEDFRAAFDLGDGQHISNVDADGVTMAAIQGLHQLVQEQKSELVKKDQEIAELGRRLAALEERVGGQPPDG